LVEQEDRLLARASHTNQARIHNGYHYPRSFRTGYRSRINLPRFARDWEGAVRSDFTALYAIATDSRVTGAQFVSFCHAIGARFTPADGDVRALFDPQRISHVFVVEEFAFDAGVLRELLVADLERAGVDVRTGTRCTHVNRAGDGLEVSTTPTFGSGGDTLAADYVFNCTYAGLNQVERSVAGMPSGLKHEITEMPLVKMPPELRPFAITVMDGPFFSVMPFPTRGLHTLSHVRYTPHASWIDRPGVDPYRELAVRERQSRFAWMRRDAARYLPGIADASFVQSLFEVKTVLVQSESDDSRPILMEKYRGMPGLFSVLGGKLDNVYDVIERLDAEDLDTLPSGQPDPG
jgi:glycine/D-amino acid oxidase-like deaminating enzyme